MTRTVAQLFLAGLTRWAIADTENAEDTHICIVMATGAVCKLDWSMPREELVDAIATVVLDKLPKHLWEVDEVVDEDAPLASAPPESTQAEENAAFTEVMEAAAWKRMARQDPFFGNVYRGSKLIEKLVRDQ